MKKDNIEPTKKKRMEAQWRGRKKWTVLNIQMLMRIEREKWKMKMKM